MYLVDVVLPELLLTRALRYGRKKCRVGLIPIGKEKVSIQRPLADLIAHRLYLCGTNCWDAVLFKTTRNYYLLAFLKKGEALEEGDLIWYSGHVMIVSDIKKNRLIEALDMNVDGARCMT